MVGKDPSKASPDTMLPWKENSSEKLLEAWYRTNKKIKTMWET